MSLKVLPLRNKENAPPPTEDDDEVQRKAFNKLRLQNEESMVCSLENKEACMSCQG